MAKRVFTREAHTRVMDDAKAAGSSTFRAEERRSKGLGLDPLVDPAAHGLIRRSLCRFEELDDHFALPNGVAISVETLLDGTGSMGRENINLALEKLGISYDLLSENALTRYDPQIATAMFGDTEDPCVVQRGQFEMDVEIAHQITMIDVSQFEGHGNDKENPEYGIFGAAYLTDADIWRYGLRNYHTALSDEAIVHRYDLATLERIYGKTVWDKVKENGHDIDRNHLPNVPETMQAMLQRTHAFFFLFKEAYPHAGPSWVKVYGRERVINIPSTGLLPFFQAAVIGLTEGVCDLQSLEDFLRGYAGGAEIGKGDAAVVRYAVAHIPIGAQAALPGFNKIPAKGSVFAKKRDLWPIGFDENGNPIKETKSSKPSAKAKSGAKPSADNGSDMWL